MPRRAVAAVVGAGAAAAGLLTACSKPTPQVTFLANRTVTQVPPQTYCFDQQHCKIDSTAVHTVKAASGSTILVDVPRSVADDGWQVQAMSQGSDGKFTPVDSPGASSPVINDQHSTRVTVPTGSGSYVLVIRAGGAHSSAGTWIARVTVTAS